MFGIPCYPAVCPGYARPTALTPCAAPYAAPGAYSTPAVYPASTSPAKSQEGGCSGWSGIVALFILVGLLALFIPGGFFFILLLILLLILICSCGVCRSKY